MTLSQSDRAASAPRKALTRTEIITLCQRQTAAPILCGCGCGEPLDPVNERVVDEHVIPRKLAETGSEAERDALENRRFYRWPCAVKKTKADLARIAKGARQGAEKGQYARRQKRGQGSIKSAGFSTRTRKMDGSIGLTKRAQREAAYQSGNAVADQPEPRDPA